MTDSTVATKLSVESIADRMATAPELQLPVCSQSEYF